MRRGLDIFEILLLDDSGLCPVCGGPLEYNLRTGRPGQWAHLLSASKLNYKKYGAPIIDSPHNGKLVCSLACNNAIQVNPKTQPVLAEKIVTMILSKKDPAGS